MPYDFDTLCNRRHTDCLKYDAGIIRKGRDDLLPLWVADMDFPLPAEVLDDLKEAVNHGIFGYGFPGTRYYDAVLSWYEQSFSWRMKPDWIVQTPGVVFALGAAIQAFTSPGDAVIIQQPVYYPFEEIIKKNRRVLVNNELVYQDGHYGIDFDDFESQVIEHQVKLFILCSPHNPVGRVWTSEELARLGHICARHGVIVVADEIHSDFIYPGHIHQVFTELDPGFKDFSIVCTSPSKTFNIAGLHLANIVIADPGLRKRFSDVLGAFGYGASNTLALRATEAVYTKGKAWLDELKSYLQVNLDFSRSFIAERLPAIDLIEPQGTYLIWLDCERLGLGNGLDDFVCEEAGLWLDAGTLFGQHSAQFERINIACPRQTLAEAFKKLERAVSRLPTRP